MAFGTAVSQEGYDAKNAADYEKVHDSRFPNLKIWDQGSFTFSAGDGVRQTIVNHNLGFVPMFHIYLNEVTGSGDNTDLVSDGTRWHEVDGQWIMTSDKLQFEGNDQILTEGEAYYYIYYLDLEQNITYNLIKTTSSSLGSSANYGIKISKPGKSVHSNDPRDFVLNSRYRSPLIYFVDFQIVDTSFGITVNHGLGYYPMFMVYQEDENNPGEYAMLKTDRFTILNADTSDIDISTFNSNNAGLSTIVIKDPIEV